MSLAQRLDSLVQNGVFHLTNTVFEGSIGLVHIFLHQKVYGDALPRIAAEQILFGKFFGVMMVALATISYGSRKDLRVASGLALYHCAASSMNFVWGCGIDGVEDRARDFFHASMHLFMGLGFSWMVYRGRRRKTEHLPLKAPWVQRGNRLELEIVARNWSAALEAIQEISTLAEKLDHHPELHLTEYRKLKIVIRTFCQKSRFQNDDVTDKDVELARAIESIPLSVSEKWARETNAVTWLRPLKKSE